MTDYWSVEIRRLFWISGAGIALAFLTGYWLPSFLAVSLIYISWMLFKLRQLQRWLISGQSVDDMPDSDGAWEQIAYLNVKPNKKVQNVKKSRWIRWMRFNNILSALPDAAILLMIAIIFSGQISQQLYC